MIVTEIEHVEKQKYRVSVDGESSFLLFKSELDKYHLERGLSISPALFEDIMENTVSRRAKQKALALLKYMDRTEHELTVKLRAEEYPDEVIARTVEYVKQYHYLDDLRYAQYFIRSKQGTKSVRQIKALLMQKGVSDSLIQAAYDLIEEDGDSCSEEEAIRKAIQKKTKNVESLTKEERLKICASLYRKGFKMENIKKVFRLYEDDC